MIMSSSTNSFALPIYCTIFILFALDGSEALLGTYNFHQPVQLNRLFKSDPRHQMAMLTNEDFGDDVAPSYFEQSQSPPKVPNERIFLNSNIQEPGLPRNSKPMSSLNSLDLYEKMYPLYRRMV